MLCKPRNSTKGNFYFYPMFLLSLSLVLMGGRGWVSPRCLTHAPLGVTGFSPQSSVSMALGLLGVGMEQEGWHDFSALCSPTLIPRRRCLLGQ